MDTTDPVIVFVLAGRRPNMELQIPLMKDVLTRHPNVEYHVWNLARTPADRAWLPTVEGERITVFNDLNWCDRFDGTGFGYAPVYGYYTQPQFSGHRFVKIDDDVVFLASRRFGPFVDAITPGRVLSANVVNNGANTALIPGMWERFAALGCPLLDVHVSNAYAQAAHGLFLGGWRPLLTRPLAVTPTRDWVSINMVGYDWATACELSARIGAPQPARIADRDMREWGRRIGDEGIVNTMDRAVLSGFTACHLTFQPQRVTNAQADAWRAGYRRVVDAYLAGEPDDGWDGPVGLNAVSYAYPRARGDSNTVKRVDWRRAYRGPGWTRRRMLRAIAPGAARAVNAAAEPELAELFRWVMACEHHRAAAAFMTAWTRTGPTGQRALILASWPDADTTWGEVVSDRI